MGYDPAVMDFDTIYANHAKAMRNNAAAARQVAADQRQAKEYPGNRMFAGSYDRAIAAAEAEAASWDAHAAVAEEGYWLDVMGDPVSLRWKDSHRDLYNAAIKEGRVRLVRQLPTTDAPAAGVQPTDLSRPRLGGPGPYGV